MVMAQIYTTCGRYDEAMDEIEYALSLETGVTTHTLELASWAKPLLELPRFQQLIKQYAI